MSALAAKLEVSRRVGKTRGIPTGSQVQRVMSPENLRELHTALERCAEGLPEAI